MSKFHINAKGVPAPCKATKGNCPFGGESGNENHFDTMEEAQAHADKQGEAENSILPGVTSVNERGQTNYRKLSEKEKEFRDDMTAGIIHATLGPSRAHHESVVMREMNYNNFESDGGLEDITSRFDQNDFVDDPDFEVQQNLLYYFPKPDNEMTVDSSNVISTHLDAYNAEDEDEAEKRLEDATNGIVDLHEIMQETRSKPLIRRKLAEKNEDRVFERFAESNPIKSDRPSGKFNDKNVGKHAAKVFATMASSDKFYRYRHSQAEAEEHYSRQGAKITNYHEDRIAQKAAFELAKEFHDNKVLNGVLGSDNKQIVNRMRKRFEKMFETED